MKNSKKKNFGGTRAWGVRVDVNQELKFLGKFTNKKSGGRGVGGVKWGEGWWGSGWM